MRVWTSHFKFSLLLNQPVNVSSTPKILQLPGDGGRNRCLGLFAGLGLFCLLRAHGFLGVEDGELAVQLFDALLRLLYTVQRAGMNRGDVLFKRSQFLLYRCPGRGELLFEPIKCDLRLWQGVRCRRLRSLCRDQEPQHQQQHPDLAAHNAAEKKGTRSAAQHVSIPVVEGQNISIERFKSCHET